MLSYYMNQAKTNEEQLKLTKLEEKFADYTKEFSKNSDVLEIYVLTESGIWEAFFGSIWGDVFLINIAINLVTIYTTCVLGTFNPVYFRFLATFFGILSCMGAYVACLGFSAICGFEHAGIHNFILFLLLGIGVDDMYVICSQLDRTDPNKSVVERMKEGMAHAGSSITITSLTVSFFSSFSRTLSLSSSVLSLRCLLSNLSVSTQVSAFSSISSAR